MNKKVEYNDYSIEYNVPAKDVRVYRMKKDIETGIDKIEAKNSVAIKSSSPGIINIDADSAIEYVAIYNASGTLLSRTECNGETSANLSLPTTGCMYIIKTMFADGKCEITKYMTKK